MPLPMDPNHAERRFVLRVIGPLIAGVGLVFAVAGFGSFFIAFGGGGPPRYFWCAFIGLPLFGVGISITKFAYLGAVTRYMANEVSPVGTDVVHYMAEGTRDAVRDVATAIGEGISAGDTGVGEPTVRCHKCNELNEVLANFCKSCGASLGKAVACRGCGELNDPDARFCDHCGKPLPG